MDESEITIKKQAEIIAKLISEMKALRKSMKRAQEIIEEKRAELQMVDQQVNRENQRRVALSGEVPD